MTCRSLFAIVLVSAFAAGCGDEEPKAAGADAAPGGADAAAPDAAAAAAAHGLYEHRLPDCVSDGLTNCAPSIELCPDGSATMLVTDIANGGTYTVEGDEITARFEVGDVPDVIVFTRSDDAGTLVDDWLEWEWLRVEDPEFSGCD